MRATCGAFVGYGERGAFGAGWDGEEKAVGSAVCSGVTGVSGVGGQGGARAGGKDCRVSGDALSVTPDRASTVA